METPTVQHVSDTAFWIAELRARETKRKDALFQDPFAAKLAGTEGPRITDAIKASTMVGWSVALRTHIIDAFIVEAVNAGVDTIVNLGAGLDARPYRMQIPIRVRWIEADYPHVIEYKENILRDDTPSCPLTREKVDLADADARKKFLSEVDAKANKILFLTEGVLPYLSVEQVSELGADLGNLEHTAYWIVDYVTPESAEHHVRSGVSKHLKNSPFRFYPANWNSFFDGLGFQPKEIRYYVEETIKLKRDIPIHALRKFLYLICMPFVGRERALRLRRSSGYALMTPKSSN